MITEINRYEDRKLTKQKSLDVGNTGGHYVLQKATGDIVVTVEQQYCKHLGASVQCDISYQPFSVMILPLGHGGDIYSNQSADLQSIINFTVGLHRRRRISFFFCIIRTFQVKSFLGKPNLVSWIFGVWLKSKTLRFLITRMFCRIAVSGDESCPKSQINPSSVVIY